MIGHVRAGFDSYDWFQVQTVRLAVFFVKGSRSVILSLRCRRRFLSEMPCLTQRSSAACKSFGLASRPKLMHWQNQRL